MFPKIGVPPVIIHFTGIVPNKNQPGNPIWEWHTTCTYLSMVILEESMTLSHTTWGFSKMEVPQELDDLFGGIFRSWNGWFGGTPILGKHHIYPYLPWKCRKMHANWGIADWGEVLALEIAQSLRARNDTTRAYKMDAAPCCRSGASPVHSALWHHPRIACWLIIVKLQSFVASVGRTPARFDISIFPLFASSIPFSTRKHPHSAWVVCSKIKLRCCFKPASASSLGSAYFV